MRIDAPSITGSFVVNNATLPDISGLATVSGNTFTGNQVINGTIVATGTTLVSGSAQVSYTGITNIPSGIISGSAQLPSGIVSGSAQVTTYGFAITGSNTFQGSQTVNGSLVVTGSLTAQQFIVSSSVTYLTESFASGSHKFGDSSDDTHQFTGSVVMSGNLSVTGSITSIGSGPLLKLTNTSAGAGAGSIQFYSGSNQMWNLGTHTNNDMYLYNNTTATYNIWVQNSNGYVGINKSSNTTNSQLDVNGNAIISGSLTTTGDLTINSNGAIFNRTSSGEPYLFFRKDGVNRGSIYGITGGGLRLFDQSDNQVLTMTSSFIGVNVTTPGSVLHVKGGTAGGADFGAELRVWENTFGAVLQGFTYGTTAAFLGNFRYNINTPASSKSNYYNAGHGMLFLDGVHIYSSQPGGTSGDAFTPSERLTILNNGNVGVSVTSPASKLHVGGNIKYSGRIFSSQAIVGNIYTNLTGAAAPSYILVYDLNETAGWSLVGHCNAASYTCWNISQIWIQKNYSSLACSAGITGLYKSGCNMTIVDLSYNGGRYIAIGYTSNPEIDVVWSGYNLTNQFTSDGQATVVAGASVTVNSTLATY